MDATAVRGEIVLADLNSAREIVHRMNRDRDLAAHPGTAAKAGELNAMGLIDEILHHVVQLYRTAHGSAVTSTAFDRVADAVGEQTLRDCLSAFTALYPPPEVYGSERTVQEYLEGTHDERTGWEIALEQLVMLGLENRNPACGPFSELFHDLELTKGTAYRDVLVHLREHFLGEPGFGPDDEPLLDLLEKPAKLFPDSLYAQLSYMREHWGEFIGNYLFRLLRGLDYLREEQKVSFAGPGPARTYTYSGVDPERFSPDRDWMPNVVLIAKSVLVWLDQLSGEYQREIDRLDQVPEEEIDRLASYGINALWLIGLWERSSASRRIKHIGGNPEAEASAYALYDYEIAGKLGGWQALHTLREKCARRNIRLASDMVPNHTGIDGRWVIEHPDWFIQLDRPPFPGYSFTGEDLSRTPGTGLYLEDHYYDRSDAAVVFLRKDHETGEQRFIYHGNDGTSMPWNDTAQLDFLNPETREAVIQTILHVARSFSIIRFDAAMTLARKHIRRLWFPEPGGGGDIASRAEHGLSEHQFNEAMPEEFWREVVDRVAAEVPDTLLLAEAFWMMEGYFVRTLGMHRVYNSAFMNMLKNEDNQKYRQTIKNTIEFDKDILKRFVNFMNNPDEETAIAQFGKGDKYFGVCTLMITLPGLPMIGHGQIEGFSEKYGMEFRRAYWEEKPDSELIRRHEREIFPLIKRRYLFSSVRNFLLYDLRSDGGVNENVFAYSNQVGAERSLVLYNNAYERAWGWIKTSVEYAEKVDGSREHRRRDLADALGVHREHGHYCLFQDTRDGLWYIRRSIELHDRGMFVSLDGYKCQVFLNFHEVKDNEFAHYAQLVDELAGRGVPDVETALSEISLRPLLDLFSTVANSNNYTLLSQALMGVKTIDPSDVDRLLDDYERFLRMAGEYRPAAGSAAVALDDLRGLISSTTRVSFLELERTGGNVAEYRQAVRAFEQVVSDRPDVRDIMCTWVLLAPLARTYESAPGLSEDWGLVRRAARAFHSDEQTADWPQLLRILLTHRGWWKITATAADLLSALVRDSDATRFMGFNEYEDAVWYNRDRYRELCWWLFATAAVDQCAESPADEAGGCRGIVDLSEVLSSLREAEMASGYRVPALLAAAGVSPSGDIS
jgi:glycosidase